MLQRVSGRGLLIRLKLLEKVKKKRVSLFLKHESLETQLQHIIIDHMQIQAANAINYSILKGSL